MFEFGGWETISNSYPNSFISLEVIAQYTKKTRQWLLCLGDLVLRQVLKNIAKIGANNLLG